MVLPIGALQHEKTTCQQFCQGVHIIWYEGSNAITCSIISRKITITASYDKSKISEYRIVWFPNNVVPIYRVILFYYCTNWRYPPNSHAIDYSVSNRSNRVLLNRVLLNRPANWMQYEAMTRWCEDAMMQFGSVPPVPQLNVLVMNHPSSVRTCTIQYYTILYSATLEERHQTNCRSCTYNITFSWTREFYQCNINTILQFNTHMLVPRDVEN